MSDAPVPGTVLGPPPAATGGAGRGRTATAVGALATGGLLLGAAVAGTAGWPAGCAVTVLAWAVPAVTWPVLARRLVAVTVSGTSMQPTYRDGERVIARRGGSPRVGQVVVVEEPAVTGEWVDPPLPSTAPGREVAARRWMIKRVVAVAGDRTRQVGRLPGGVVPPGALVLLGDNRRGSFDSRDVGYFPVERVLGIVARTRRAYGR
ncbi:MAG: S26 family signal peptidase [Mycobacteriales bacterium]